MKRCSTASNAASMSLPNAPRRSAGRITVVAIEAPPIQTTTANTCKARARARSSMIGLSLLLLAPDVRRRFSGGIHHRVARPHAGAGRHFCRLDLPRTQDVKDLFALREQIIGDDAAVASPPHRFRAHDGAAPLFTDFQKPHEAFMESLAQRVVGVIVKALVLPEPVDLRLDIVFRAQTAKLGDVLVGNLEIGKASRQRVAIILRVGTRTRNGAHVHHQPHPGFIQQSDEFLDRSGRMSDGEKRLVHDAIARPAKTPDLLSRQLDCPPGAWKCSRTILEDFIRAQQTSACLNGGAEIPGSAQIDYSQPGSVPCAVPIRMSMPRAIRKRHCLPSGSGARTNSSNWRTILRIVDIRERTYPIASPIANAYIDFSKMTLSLVAVITDVIRDGKPVVGYGFNSNGRYGQGSLMRERFIPRILAAKPESLVIDEGSNLDPHKIWNCMFSNEKPGGHGERSVAIGTIDMAVWDAVAKIEGKPLFQLLAERYGDGKQNRKIFVYAAGGYYYPGQAHEKLKDEMRSYIDRGYTVVKKKIGGASLEEDLRRIDSILSVLQDGQKLAVDANGRFDLDTAIAYAKALSQYDLFWYEEAGDPLDFELQATLRNYYDKPMATGENLFSMQDARNLIRYGGMRPDRDWLQFDCALSYGLVEYLRTLDMLHQHGWSRERCIPHGGHQMSLNIAAGLGLGGNESYPDLFQPFGGFPDGVKVENGFITMPDLPGIGFEGKANLYSEMQALSRYARQPK